MLSGNRLEIRFLKVLGLLAIFSFGTLGFLEWIEQPKQFFIDNFLVRGVPAFAILIFLIIFLTLKPQKYAVYLFVSIISFHLFFNLFMLGHELEGYRLQSVEIVGVGRLMDYIFMSFPLTALFCLFFSRLWANYLWLALSCFRPLKEFVILSSYEKVFIADDWDIIISNGYAVNKWALTDGFMTSIIFLFVISTLIHFNRWVMHSTISAETENRNLSRYFSPDIKEEIRNSGDNFNTSSTKEMDVAVMFTDIVNFTQLSEKMDPKDTLVLLSEYQSIMVDTIFKHSGTVDKFIGDAVMANFGTPKSYGNDSQNAFDCAVAMNEALEKWNQERTKNGEFEIEHRIGIHFGRCVVGNMGSKHRIEFAVLGDTVNVASRICSACKEFDTNFLISSELRENINFTLRSEYISNYKIRGREETIGLYQIWL